MDDTRKDLVENFDKYRIGLDDTFAFKCRECGKCCKNREDILLTARDIYNIAVKLGLTTKQVIETYCEVYIGQDSRIPIVRLNPRGTNRICPLLNNGKCSVHDSKPVICALYPLGRVIAFEEPSKEYTHNIPKQLSFILNPINCGSRRIKQTVRSWLERFNIPIEDSFFFQWNETIIPLINSVRQFEEKGITEKSQQMMWDGIFSALYAVYDTNQDFPPQFENNSQKILGLFKTLEQTYHSYHVGQEDKNDGQD